VFKPVSKALTRGTATYDSDTVRDIRKVVWTLPRTGKMKQRKITSRCARYCGMAQSTDARTQSAKETKCRMEWYVAGIECTVIAALQAELWAPTGIDRDSRDRLGLGVVRKGVVDVPLH
jgi:hypothetical protein